jgi:hypothetical protein
MNTHPVEKPHAQPTTKLPADNTEVGGAAPPIDAFPARGRMLIEAIQEGLAELDKERRRLVRHAKPTMPRVTAVLERELLWVLLLEGIPLAEPDPPFSFRFRLHDGLGFKIKQQVLKAALADRLWQFLTQRVPELRAGRQALEVISVETLEKMSAPIIPWNDELLRAAQSSALGPGFAAMLEASDDRTRYVGMLYRDFKDESFNHKLDMGFADLASQRTDSLAAGSAARILLVAGPPRIGKSYTVLFHLFQRYCLGEQVFHPPLTAPDSDIEGLLQRLRWERADALDRGRSRPMQWVFLEDPFGAISF